MGALGIPFSLMGLFRGDDEFYDTRMGGNARTARHALAIDERRADFAPRLWQPREGVDLRQVWFAGCHGDVGGGHAPDDDGSRIGDVALGWMLDEAERAGLGIEGHLREGPPAEGCGGRGFSLGWPVTGRCLSSSGPVSVRCGAGGGPSPVRTANPRAACLSDVPGVVGWKNRQSTQRVIPSPHSVLRIVSVPANRRRGRSGVTVRRKRSTTWIESGQLERDPGAGEVRYAARPTVAHKLDPYKAIIDACLGEFPRLSAQRLFDEVRAAGHAGAYGRVREYLGHWLLGLP